MNTIITSSKVFASYCSLSIIFFIAISLLLFCPVYGSAKINTPPNTIHLQQKIKTIASDFNIDLSKRIGKIHIVEREGKIYIVLKKVNGHKEFLTASQYLRLIKYKQHQRNSNSLFLVFNITTWFGVIWVALGLLGQLLFTGRMIVQWLVSEKARKSVVPASFWWMSLGGASMLVIYFIWRKDIVGFIGQSTGWAIYARNLWLIYRRKYSG